MLKARWDAMDPKKKRWFLIGSVIGIAAIVINMVSSPDSTAQRTSRQDNIRHVLTDRDTRNVGLEALSAELRTLRSEVAKQQRELDKREREGVAKMRAADNEVYRKEVSELRAEIARLAGMIPPEPAEDEEPVVIDLTDSSGIDTPEDPLGVMSGASNGLQIDPSNPGALFATSKWPRTSRTSPSSAAPASTTSQSGDQAPSTASPSQHPSIKRHVEVVPEKQEDDPNVDEEMLFLPAGSIITGTFLNGIDAPTGQGAKRDPFPSTLRIQKEAILPNRFRADIRECFLIVSGYGDLSSERAYLRGETISCVREDGGVIESNLDSYAVGEDGKAGVRGRLVSKQGQIIAKSLMAGFLSGVSKAFDVKPVPVLNTRNNSGNTSFQRNDGFSGEWAQSAAVSGVGSALDRIADFYLEMAEGMFPVIEVDAGRQIDVIVSRGTNLQIRSKSPGRSPNQRAR